MRKIKWGVIGCAGIADRRTIPGMLLAENAECIAVMNRTEEKTKAVQEKYNISMAFTDIDELLAVDEIDAVYIASPLYCHNEQAMKAADAGKHILLEKPMCLTSKDAQELAEYCKNKGVKLGSAFMMRFHGAHCKMKEVINNKYFGQVVTAYAKFNTESVVVPKKWRQTKATGGGGAMMDMGIHCIDLLHFLTGLKVREVVALSGNQIFEYPDTEDAATAVFKMENGALFTIEANFNINYNAGGAKLDIYGQHGSIYAERTMGQEGTGTLRINSVCDGEMKSESVDFHIRNMYTKEIEAFSKAILDNTEVPVSAEDGIYAQKVVEAIYESAEKGIKIVL